MGHFDGNNVFCDNYEEVNTKFQEESIRIGNLFQDNYKKIVAKGELGPDHFSDRVNVVTSKDLQVAYQFSIDVYYEHWAKQIKCYKEKNGPDGKGIRDFEQFVKRYTYEGDCAHSMKCNFKKLANHVRPW